MPGMASQTGAVPGTSSGPSGSSYGSSGNGAGSSTSSRTSGRDLTRGSSSLDSQRRMFTEACSDWVREKPLSAVAMAFGLGLLVGRVGR